MKATIRLAFLLAVASFRSVAQDKIHEVGPRPDATIVRNMRLWVPGGIEDRVDSMLVRNNLVLEPIKIFYQEGETNLTTGVTKNEPMRKKLQWYYITDVSKMVGMSFDVDKEPSSKTIETYTVKQGKPKMGHPIEVEPYFNSGIRLEDLSRGPDTVIDGRKCILLKTTKQIPYYFAGTRDYILKLRIAIDTTLNRYSFPFVSEIPPNHVGGGAVVLAESTLKSGIAVSFRYKYREFTPAERKVFEKYESLFFQNISLLDRVKK